MDLSVDDLCRVRLLFDVNAGDGSSSVEIPCRGFLDNSV